MTYDELERLNNLNKEIKNEKFIELALDAMRRKTDRTLIWGYTCERESFHVYLKDMTIHKVIYGHDEQPMEYPINSVHDVIPNKRAYPEASDYEFCKFIRNLDVRIPFTTYNKEREPKQYYGQIL